MSEKEFQIFQKKLKNCIKMWFGNMPYAKKNQKKTATKTKAEGNNATTYNAIMQQPIMHMMQQHIWCNNATTYNETNNASDNASDKQ